VSNLRERGADLLATLATLLGITLLGGQILLGGGLDDTDGDGLSHITDGETSKRRVGGERLAAHGLGGLKANHSGISLLDGLGGGLKLLTGTLVNLGEDLSELAGNVSSVAVKNGGVTVGDLTRVVQDDDLGGEVLNTGGGVVLGVRADISTTDILDRDVLDVEANVVSGLGLGDLLVVHFNGLNLGGDTSGGEGDNLTGGQDTSLNTTDGDSSDTANLVDVLEGKTEGLLRGTLGDLEGIESLKEGGALVPGEVGRTLQHVVTVPAGDGDEGDGLGLVTNLLQVVTDLVLDLGVTGLGPVDRLVIHLVDADDHLLDTEGVGEESVLTGLSVARNTGLELTSTRGNDENGNISLYNNNNPSLEIIVVILKY
jgi:hypothetical protein